MRDVSNESSFKKLFKDAPGIMIKNINISVANLVHFVRNKKGYPHLLVVLFFFLATAYYMGPSITNCNTDVYGFGDNTAGPIWRYGVNPNQPLGGYQDATNYPLGEDLYSPVNVSTLGQNYAYWGLAKIFGPVCGYNIFNFIGFISSGLVVFYFIRFITKNKWIALFAGYAATFVPYYQVKVGGHPSYGYQSLLVGLIWSAVNFLHKPSKKYAIIFSIILTACTYFDPYFVLLAGIICLVAFIVYLHRLWRGLNKISNDLRHIITAISIFIVLITPLLTVAYAQREAISSRVTGLRGNVVFEARACSILPHEIALPFVLHDGYIRILGRERYISAIDSLTNHFSCGIGEDSVGINPYLLIIVIGAIPIIIWERLNPRRLVSKSTQRKGQEMPVIPFMVILFVVSAALALPPLNYHGIKTPSQVLLDLTTTWRTLTRLFVLMNISIVFLSSFIMAYAWKLKNPSKPTKIFIFLLIFVLSIIHYQAFKPFSGNLYSQFSYSSSVPQVYKELAKLENVRALAEYPIDRYGESDVMSYYLSMQRIHGKRLFNSVLPDSPQEPIRQAMRNLSSRQTVSLLNEIGVSHILVHGGVPNVSGDSFEQLYYSAENPYNPFPINSAVKNNNSMLLLKPVGGRQGGIAVIPYSGFVRNDSIIFSSFDMEYEALNGAEIVFRDIKNLVKENMQLLPGSGKEAEGCFEISVPTLKGSEDLEVYDDGVLIAQFKIYEKYSTIKFTAPEGSILSISSKSGYNFRLKNLGC